MQITKSTYTRVTFSAERVLGAEPPTYPADRGIHYDPNGDGLAVKEARSFWDAAAKSIRDQVKDPILPIGLDLFLRDGAIVARASGVVVK